MVMDPLNEGSVFPCRISADRMVVGIAAPAGNYCEALEVQVATSGVNLCKADASFGPIRPGDLLISSPTPGHAMKMQSFEPGTVIGKALEPLDEGTGMIKVLVTIR